MRMMFRSCSPLVERGKAYIKPMEKPLENEYYKIPASTKLEKFMESPKSDNGVK